MNLGGALAHVQGATDELGGLAFHQTLQAFKLTGRQGGPRRVLVAEARLRPLTNPMKMNGCAMVVLNPPGGAEAAAQQICGWVVDTLGEAGARAEVWTPG